MGCGSTDKGISALHCRPAAPNRRCLCLRTPRAGWTAISARGPPGPPPPLAPLGATPFRSAVWALLRELPYGSTTTYGRIAARLGGMSARAVGGAVGRNPISLMIPCHRVLGADGSLTGYAGGTDRKAALLALEGVPCGR